MESIPYGIEVMWMDNIADYGWNRIYSIEVDSTSTFGEWAQ